MIQVLVPNFLNDPAEYNQAESTWRQTWAAVVHDAGQVGRWQTPWINTMSNDGTCLRDGNPIFSAVCPERHLGVRVIQVEPEDDFDEITAWTDTFGEGDPDAVKELVIHCVLSDATLATAADLIKRWITDENGTSFSEGLAKVHAVIDERYKSGHSDTAAEAAGHSEHRP
jgi:hypothetical protein